MRTEASKATVHVRARSHSSLLRSTDQQNIPQNRYVQMAAEPWKVASEAQDPTFLFHFIVIELDLNHHLELVIPYWTAG